MNVVDWAQIISAAAAAVAAGMAAYSTRLVLKQLRYQFDPHLCIANELFQIRMCKTSIEDLFWEKPTEDAMYLNGGTTDYMFRLTNTGAGGAQDVRIFCDYDFESVYEDVLKKLSDHAPEIEVSQEEWGARICADGEHIGGFKNPDQAQGFVDYIRPCRDDRIEVTFNIDPTLTFFSLVYGFYIMSEKVKKGVSQPEQTIDVDFVVEYNDAAGARVEQRYPHRLTVSGGRWQDDMDDGVCFVNLLSR